MQDYQKLTVWAKSHQLVLILYEVTGATSDRTFPGLTSQIRRAAASIPANIAEGCGHESRAELTRFLAMALASSYELNYHLRLAADLGMIQKSDYARLGARCELVQKMLTSFISKVKQKTAAQRPPARRPAIKPPSSSP